jgi:hypothetical protein
MNRIRTTAAALGAALCLAAPAAAQSILSAEGLGYPLEATDARSRGLGGVTTGLPEPRLSLVNPAETAGLPAAGLTVTFHGDRIASPAEEGGGFETSRFPAIQAAFPLGARFVGTLGYAAMLDQNWGATRFDSLEVAGRQEQVIHRFVSQGGVGRIRAGAAFRPHGRIDVGASLDLYTGRLGDSLVTRIAGLVPATEEAVYEWRGAGFGAGARWRGEALTLSAAATAGGRLRAVPADTGTAGASYALPLRLDAGASARIAQGALLAVSGRWTGWSAAGADMDGSAARDVVQATAGIELEGLRFVGRPLPVRIGGRHTQLPFAEGDAFPEERALTGGLGIRFAGGAALLDLGAERGSRSGGTLDESFWRVSLSLALLGR